ncbi:MAG: COP23 domain-containing protein [Hormoscilla sp. GUM202]|nr:COP23 domain-containing protein [Hormoscilla sp. GUM202]
MKYQLFTKMLTGLAIALTLGTAATEPSAAQSQKFFCDRSDGAPATVVRTSKGNVPIIIWVDRGFELSGWTPQRRCQAVSDRFQQYDDLGLLEYIRTGTVSRHPVLCVANRQGGACPSTQVLVTLNHGVWSKVVDRAKDKFWSPPIYDNHYHSRELRTTWDYKTCIQEIVFRKIRTSKEGNL